MHLDRFISEIRQQLAVTAQAGGDDARALAERLTAPLDSAVRLMLLDVLATAAAEITRELAPGSVELRIGTAGPEFVVIPAPTEAPTEPPAERPGGAAGDDQIGAGPRSDAPSGDGGMARINLRLPEDLKARLEQAADQEGLSLNAWLVRMLTAAVGRAASDERRERRTPRGGQRYAGWGR